MQPSGSVLNIALDPDQQGSADKKGFNRVAVEILLVHHSVQTLRGPTGTPSIVRFQMM